MGLFQFFLTLNCIILLTGCSSTALFRAPATLNRIGTDSLPKPCTYLLGRSHVSRAHVSYLAAWRQVINPNGNPFRVIYAGIGADATSPLLMANASLTLGIDLHPYDLEAFQRYMAVWDRVDSDAVGVPPKDKKWIQARHPGIKVGRKELQADFDICLELRKVRGYWDNGVLGPWSHERMMIIELKHLGVSRESISFSRVSNNVVKLTFLWSLNPDEAPTRREIYLISGDFESVLATGSAGVDFHASDLYLQKSIPSGEAFLEEDLPRVTAYLKKGGVMLFSAGRREKDKPNSDQDRFNRVLTFMGSGYLKLAPDKEVEAAAQMRSSVLQSSHGKDPDGLPWGWDYGWKLFGIRKRK